MAKVRTGFVSNSSSSSFVIKTSKEKELAERNGMKLISVKDLVETMTKINGEVESLMRRSGTKRIPTFLRPPAFNMNSWWDAEPEIELYPYLDELKKLEAMHPGCYISEEFDRDIASERGIYFELFEGNL